MAEEKKADASERQGPGLGYGLGVVTIALRRIAMQPVWSMCRAKRRRPANMSRERHQGAVICPTAVLALHCLCPSK